MGAPENQAIGLLRTQLKDASGFMDADLARPLDLSAVGLGQRTVGFLLNNAVVGHIFSHTGEISCLKGLRGKRGSP